MDLERIAGALSQAVLGVVWIFVVALALRFHLRILRPKSAVESLFASSESTIKRSYAAFTFAFMPALASWLPALGRLPSTGELFVPAILTWLVLLVFGTMQFYLNLIPAKAAIMGGGVPVGAAVRSESASVAQQRRNV